MKNEKIINPFFLPSETNARFNLLIATVLTLSIILGSYIPSYIFSQEKKEQINFQKNEYSQTEITSQDDLKKSGKEIISSAINDLRPLVIITLIILTTIISAMYIYRKYPNRIIKRQKLQSLDKLNDSKFLKIKNELQNLADLYKIKLPEIFLSPGFSSGGQAFGFSKKSMLRLDNGLRLVLIKNIEKFRCIVLHEMGHIVNKDVSKMYISDSLWKAVLLLFAVPTILLIIFTFGSGIWDRVSDGISFDDIKKILFLNIPNTLSILLSIICSFIILYWILTGLVRMREYYADWRAASVGAKEGLLNLFNENLKLEKPLRFYKKLFSWHPLLNERIKKIENPSQLFVLSKEIPFLVGLLIPLSLFSFFTVVQFVLVFVQIFTGGIQIVSQNILINYISTIISFTMVGLFCFLPFIIAAYLISSSLGIQLQRNIISSLLKNETQSFSFKMLCITSLIVTCGTVIGSFLIPYFSPLTQLINSGVIEFIIYKLKYLLLSFFLAFIVNFFWLYYIKVFTPLVYNRYTKKKSPKLRFFLFNSASAFLLAILYLPVAGVFFLFYSTEIEFVNSAIKLFFILTPLLYILFFAITGIVLLVSNSVVSTCPNCNKSLPFKSLLGKDCAQCGTELTPWIYLEMK